jgi:hypothetical protein
MPEEGVVLRNTIRASPKPTAQVPINATAKVKRYLPFSSWLGEKLNTPTNKAAGRATVTINVVIERIR